MKKTLTILTAVLLTAIVFAQSPEKMNYQAVVKDVSNNLISNQPVNFRISILQGSASGTSVYTETQGYTTNAFGLANLIIGSGTSGDDFSLIDWAIGPYFIKIEMDITGGTNYQMMGTSQLLSVPYALYAKTADIDGSETKVTAGSNVIVTGAGTTVSPYVVNASGGSTGHYVGELFGGGVVFWVDHTGQHGLIASMVDLSTSQAWSIFNASLVGESAQSDWNGLGNSNAIVEQHGPNGWSAAKLCLDYTNTNYGTGVYSDWYLPARAELNHLWNNIYEVQKALDSDGNPATTAIAKTFYWSSSEYYSYYAYSFNFGLGTAPSTSKTTTSYVRAVRAF